MLIQESVFSFTSLKGYNWTTLPLSILASELLSPKNVHFELPFTLYTQQCACIKQNKKTSTFIPLHIVWCPSEHQNFLGDYLYVCIININIAHNI